MRAFVVQAWEFATNIAGVHDSLDIGVSAKRGGGCEVFLPLSVAQSCLCSRGVLSTVEKLQKLQTLDSVRESSIRWTRNEDNAQYFVPFDLFVAHPLGWEHTLHALRQAYRVPSVCRWPSVTVQVYRIFDVLLSVRSTQSPSDTLPARQKFNRNF